MSNVCAHVVAMTQFEANKLRVSSIAEQIANACSTRIGNDWDTLNFCGCDGDDVDVWQVFLRRTLSSTLRTSSIVLLDTRKK